MIRTFVAINDPVHGLLRRLTRQTPLVPRTFPNGQFGLLYDFRPDKLPTAYYSLAIHHSLNGMAVHEALLWGGVVQPRERIGVPEKVSYLDVVKMDRRCLRDLRWRWRATVPGMLAAELLTFGSGALRAMNDDPQDRVHRYLWARYGRLATRHEVVYAGIRALQSRPGCKSLESRKETYQSTNLVYGDTYGELEQIWDRRADTAFLEDVVRSLRSLKESSGLLGYLYPPANLPGIMQLHRRAQRLWNSPPASARALLRRLDFILGNTVVDCSPEVTVCDTPEMCEDEAADTADWQADNSGYDGWLGG